MKGRSRPVPSPARTLGLGTCVALLLGNTVGVGIFLTPAEVAAAAGTPGVYLAYWLVGAVLAGAGALAFAELGVMFPHAGGDYIYLDRAWGRNVAHAWGVLALFGTFAGSIAALAVGAMDTLEAAMPGGALGGAWVHMGGVEFGAAEVLGLALVWGTTLANCRSLKLAGLAQILLTWLPIAAYLLLCGWLWGTSGGAQMSAEATAAPVVAGPAGSALAAFGAVFFAYSGWNVLTFFAGDIEAPSRTIPRAVALGVGATFAVYLVLNLTFVEVLGVAELAATPNAGVALASALFGPAGTQAFALLLTLAIVAGLNATVIAGSRVAMAMAHNGYLSQTIGEVHSVFGTPTRALVLQAGLASALVGTGSFGFIVMITGSTMFLLSCVTVATLFVFRQRRVHSDYRCPGYPVVPLAYLAAGVAILAAGMVDNSVTVAIGLSVFAGLVVLHVAVDRRRKPPRQS